jgi:hypothetical protein
MPAATVAVASTLPASLKAGVNSGPVDGQFNVATLFVADKATRESAAQSVAAAAQKEGPAALESVGFGDAVAKALADKKSPAARESAAELVGFLAKSGAAKALEPTFISSGLYAALLETFADKMPAVRTAAVEAVREYVFSNEPLGYRTIASRTSSRDQDRREMANQDWFADYSQSNCSQCTNPNISTHARYCPSSRGGDLGYEGRREEGSARFTHKGDRSGIKQGHRTLYSCTY